MSGKNMRRAEFDKRKSGTPLIKELPGGAHFCLFYQSKDELLDILIPYFRAGLLNNELCVWIIGPALAVSDAKNALKDAVADFETCLRRGQIEFIPSGSCPAGKIASERMIAAKIDKSISGGFNGLRFSCDASPYAADAITRYNAVGAFSYSRDEFDTLGLMEVVKKHHFALVRNNGRWQVLESAEARIAKDTLRRNKEKLRSIFRNMSEGFAYHRIVLDSKGKPCDYIFLEVNPAFEKLTGLKAGNIIGKKVTQVLPGIEKDPTDWIGRYGKVALSGKPVRFESYAETLKRWHAVSAFSPFKGYFAVTFSDITARKESLEQLAAVNEELTAANEELTASNEELRVETEERQKTEEILRESERRLNKTQEIAHLGSWELDVINNRLYWSDEVYRIFGLKPQEFKATYEAFLERVHPEDRKAVDKAYTASIRQGRNTYEIEHRVVKKSTSEIRYVYEKCEHIRDKAGRILRSAGMVRDVTEQRLADKKINHLASFPQFNPNPVIEIDETGRIVFSNAACAKALKGIGAGSRTELFLPKDFSLMLKELRLGKRNDFVREVEIKGLVFLETISLLPQLKVIRIYARDITERKIAESALEEERGNLESKVIERTQELQQANRELVKEISERKGIERHIRVRSAILKIMGRASSRREYFDILAKYIKGLAGCRYCGIRVLSEEGEIPYESYIGFTSDFWDKENWLSVSRDQCACIRVITGSAILQDKSCMSKRGSFVANRSLDFVNNLKEEDRRFFRGACIQEGFNSVAVIPIRYKDEIIAAIHLADERKDMVLSEKIEFLESLTPLIGEGIHKFDIEDRMRQSHMGQGIIGSLIRYSFEEPSIEKILGRFLELLFSLTWFGAEPRGGVYIADCKTKTLALKAQRNLPEQVKERCFKVLFGKCVCGKTAQDKKIYFTSSADASHEIIYNGITEHSHYCLPILSGEKLLGIVNFFLYKWYRRDYKKEEFLSAVTNVLAEIIRRRQAEDDLIKSSRRISNILESLTEGFFAFGRDWRFTYINSAAERIMGVRREDILGKVEWDVFPEVRFTKIYENQVYCMTHKTPVSFEVLYPGIDKWFEIRAYPFEEGISVIYKDISEKKLGEERLMQAQEQLEKTKRLSDIGMLAAQRLRMNCAIRWRLSVWPHIISSGARRTPCSVSTFRISTRRFPKATRLSITFYFTRG